MITRLLRDQAEFETYRERMILEIDPFYRNVLEPRWFTIRNDHYPAILIYHYSRVIPTPPRERMRGRLTIYFGTGSARSTPPSFWRWQE